MPVRKASLANTDTWLHAEASASEAPVRRNAPVEELSPRELEIARLVARGYPNKTIAGVLEISPWTVAAHLRRVYVKLSVHSRAAMVARLLGSGVGQLPTLIQKTAASEPRLARTAANARR